MDDTSHQHQSDSDALASALGAIGAAAEDDQNTAHHFADFTHDTIDDHKDVHDALSGQGGHDGQEHIDGEPELDVDVTGLEDVMNAGDEDDLDLSVLDAAGDLDDTTQRTAFGRPPSIRKACDLCHSAKQKCSGDRPACTRCIAGGWTCNYAPRQRRRTAPKENKPSSVMDLDQGADMGMQDMGHTTQPNKKRKAANRDPVGVFGGTEMDMKLAMNMAVDLGLANEEENEEIVSMSDEQMLESIAIDGYLADLPLATFVRNLPYNAAPDSNQVNYNTAEFSSDMDQHTTSALRDAIFSLNESSGGHGGGGDEGHNDGQGDGGEVDPHLALLDLSHAMPGEDEERANEEPHQNGGLHLGHFNAHGGCNHVQMIPHILNLLTQQGLEPKPGSNTPLTLAVFAPLARSLRLFHSLILCPSCLSSPQQTLPQLALLSRTTTILTFPFPPISSSTVGSTAQIMIHGARIAGTGISELMEQHIVGVVWDSWRASIRQIFSIMERKAQDIISLSAGLTVGDDEEDDEGGEKKEPKKPAPPATSAETQRAGLMFQAMTRLVTAMDEVEGTEVRGRSLF